MRLGIQIRFILQYNTQKIKIYKSIKSSYVKYHLKKSLECLKQT
jgi:hypothetical protein